MPDFLPDVRVDEIDWAGEDTKLARLMRLYTLAGLDPRAAIDPADAPYYREALQAALELLRVAQQRVEGLEQQLRRWRRRALEAERRGR